jgi:hypothetical protein
MKNLIFPILTVLTMLQSCAPTNNDLVPDETAKKIFTPAELKGIDEMIKFVDSKVSENENLTDINQIYHAYFDKLDSYVSDGKMFPILLKDTTKFKFLEAVDKDAFSSIWKIDDYTKMVRYKDTTLTDLHGFKTLTLNYQGKYLSYLKETGKSDSLYSQIYKSIEIAGDIPPSIVSWYPTQTKKIDFTSFNARLWATVFLLRMGDPLEEKVERYLKK